MTARLSPKRGRYVPIPRVGVESSKNDETFARAMNECAHAEQKMMFACSECIFDACRMLVRASSQFDDNDGGLRITIAKIRAAVQEGRVPPVAVALGMLLSGSGVDLTANTPESNFLYAASCLKDAVSGWGQGQYVEAQANTVRCRSSLKTIVE